MSSTVTSQNVEGLFNTAVDEGNISPSSSQALNIPDLGQQIQQGLGIVADDVPASEVVLVTLLIDDSYSIDAAGNTQEVRDGYNLILDALHASKQEDNILVHTRYLNGKILTPYAPLSGIDKMNQNNYEANGGTPLYDLTMITLGTVLAKAQEFSDQGVPTRTVTLIVTDGADQHSKKSTPDKVKVVVDDMLAQETHIVAAMGIDDGQTDFTNIFKSMGIRDNWILTPGNTPREIRKAFQVFSQSVSNASKNATNFSQAQLGGFGS